MGTTIAVGLAVPLAGAFPPPEPLAAPLAGPAPFPDTGAVDLLAYDIDVRLVPERHYLAARTEVTFQSRVTRLERVRLVLGNDTLRIQGVTSGAETLAFSYDSAAAVLTVLLADSLDPGDTATVAVEYSGYITPALSGSLNNYCWLDATLGFSIVPYTWCPAGLDLYYSSRRDDVFDCRTTLTVPANWRAFGVGALVDSAVGDSTRSWTWQSIRPTPFPAFAAAAYHQSVRDIGGLSVRYCDFDTSAAGTVFQAISGVLRYFERTFGPQSASELSYVENRQVFGAAVAGLVMMPMPYQLSGFAHETAHQWWGVLLCLRYKREAWLNEGFASYSEVLYQEDTLGLAARRAELDTFAWWYRLTPPGEDLPIVPAPTGSRYYYVIVYGKGAWVLHTLRWVVGDATFFAALDRYVLAGQDSSVTLADFRAAVEAECGYDLGWFFDEWLHHAGFPVYRLNWSARPAGDSFRLTTRLDQFSRPGSPPFFRTPLPVRFDCVGADTTIIIRPAANPQIDTFVLAADPYLAVIDPDDWVIDSSYVAPSAVEAEPPATAPERQPATIARGGLRLADSGPAELFDINGRKVMTLKPGPNDVSRLTPGVYFVCPASGIGYAASGPKRAARLILTR